MTHGYKEYEHAIREARDLDNAYRRWHRAERKRKIAEGDLDALAASNVVKKRTSAAGGRRYKKKLLQKELELEAALPTPIAMPTAERAPCENATRDKHSSEAAPQTAMTVSPVSKPYVIPKGWRRSRKDSIHQHACEPPSCLANPTAREQQVAPQREFPNWREATSCYDSGDNAVMHRNPPSGADAMAISVEPAQHKSETTIEAGQQQRPDRRAEIALELEILEIERKAKMLKLERMRLEHEKT